MLVAMRVLASSASSSMLAVSAGTIADVWPSETRRRAMGIFYLGPLTGPLVIPIIGGALAPGFGWRAAMVFQTIYGGLMLLLITIAAPETLHRRKALVLPASTSPSPPTRTPNRVSRAPAKPAACSMAGRHAAELTAITKPLLVDPLRVCVHRWHPATFIGVYSTSIAE